MVKFVRWEAESGNGLEHLTIRREPRKIIAEGVVIGDRFGVQYGARYRIETTENWILRRVFVALTDGRHLSLSTDDSGIWRDESGSAVEQLNQCIDVDMSATPFSNSLPINRLCLEAGERKSIKVAYLAIPDLTIEPVEQAYTCIEPGRAYRYEGLFRHFETELRVDEMGIVEDYPSLFRRVR